MDAIIASNILRRPLFVFLSVGLLLLGGCADISVPVSNVKPNAQLTPATSITRDLVQLPEPKGKVVVAVYAFRDQTGQYKPSPDSSFSTSVTQGAASLLVKSLKDSGWFIPVERESLQNLLTERKIVRALELPSDKDKSGVNLPPLLPATVIIEGGIIGFESNVRTGGSGARYMGIGASTQYRVDQVTVNLRSIDIRGGQVLNSVSVTKTIYSYEFSAGVYKFIGFEHLLEAETGFTRNEPAQLAIKEAIEAAVIHLTVQGLRDKVWSLKDEAAWNTPVIQSYLKESQDNLQVISSAFPVIDMTSTAAVPATARLTAHNGAQVAMASDTHTGPALTTPVKMAPAAATTPASDTANSTQAVPATGT